MTKTLLIFALLLCSSIGIAQEITLKGIIKDSIGAPLEFANIVAKNTTDGALESYGITDQQGRYKLDLNTEKTYELTASYIGLKSLTEKYKVPVGDKNPIKNFILKLDPNTLDNVELVYEMPVTVKGDTIVYNADSFTNGTEKKLGDIIEKLPGVELTDDGEIEVDGKTVTKVMIEGKDFFDGDSKLATKNIPADAVKKIEVLRNYNEVSQMRGLGNDQDNTAINLRLKEGKESFWFGEINAGIGEGEKTRYRINPRLFYYSPKSQVNVITDFNNIGEVPFTFRDYFNFTGGFRGFNSRGGTGFNVSESGLSFLVNQNNRAANIEADFAAANFSYKANNKLDLSGFAIINDNRTDFINNSLNTFIFNNSENGQEQSENTQSFNETSQQGNRLAMAKLSAVYKPSEKLQVDYDILGKTAKQTEISNGISTQLNGSETTEDVVNQTKENTPLSLNQNLKAYYTLNDNNIFAVEAQHLFQEEDPFYKAVLGDRPFVNTLALQDREANDLFDINQNKLIKTTKIDAKLDYFYVINNKSNINFTLGATHSKQRFNSSIFEIFENREIPLTTSIPDNTGTTFNLTNDVDFIFSDLFFGTHYKVKTGIVTWTPGVTLHRFKTESTQNNSVTNDIKWIPLPDLFVNVQFGQSKSLRFDYQMTAQYTDVSSFAEGLIFNDFNRLYRGNRNLERAIYHNISANYYSFSLFNFTNFFGGITYNRRIDPIILSGNFEGISQVSTSTNNSNFVDEILSANGRFSKTFKKWKLNLRANLSYSNLNNITNNAPTVISNFTQSYRASAATNFKKAPNLEVGFNRSISSIENITNRTFITDRPFANFEWAFGKGFSLTADWSYYNYDDNDDNTDIDNTYQFLEAGLTYQKPNSKWEFNFNASNLFDVDVISQNNTSDIQISNTEYQVQPRILMFTTKYNL